MTQLLLAFAATALLSLATTAVWIRFARSRGLVAASDPWHDGNVPLAGGIPVALSLLPVLIMVAVQYPNFRPLVLGALAMGALGFIDDIRPLSPQVRVFAEMLAGVIVAIGGVRFSLPPEFALLSVAVTALWFVALINSFNLIDNMDGMAPGIAAISSGFLSFIALSNGNFPLAITAAAVAGATLGFLRYNFAPAKVFLGDCGSIMLGFLLAGLAVMGTRSELRSVAYVFAIPTLLLAVPILNTSFVILSRALTGVPIFAGRADHINYRLLAHGFSGRRAVLSVYGIVVVSGFVAILAGSYGPTELAPAVVAALFFVTLCYIGVYLFEGRVAAFAAAYGLVETGQGNLSVRVVILVLQVLGDLVLLSLSFVSALLLRGGTNSLAMYDPASDWLLPVLLLVRMPALFLTGSYGYLWMYVSLRDAMRLAVAIIAGTVVAAFGVAIFGSVHIPISFWILEALVALSITSGARILPRLLHDFFRSTKAPHGIVRERVIIVGAGEAARLVLREFERNPSWRYEAIALLDDDRSKIGRRFRNVPVIGTTAQARHFVRDLGVKRVIIAMPSASPERIASIVTVLEGEDCHCEMLRVELALMRAPTEGASTGSVREIRARPFRISIRGATAPARKLESRLRRNHWLRRSTLRKHRVVHICTSDISLGVLLLTQLKRLAREGYEVIGVSSPGPFAQRLRDAGIQFFPAPMVRAIDPLGDLKALAGLYRTLRRLRPAIVHTHTPKAGLLGQYAALMARVPARVHTIHGLYLPGHMTARTRPLYLALERETMRFPHLVLSQNPEDVTTAAAEKICAPGRIRYLGNGINLEYFDPAEVSPAAAGSVRQELGIAPGDRVVGIVARVNEEKGFREFFQAAATLAASFPTAKFLVIGPIEREKFDALDPHELAAAAGVADRLIYAGLRDDMRELYSVMDVLVLPSHREGFPRAPMEASAMGRPVVATNIRGCRQVVRDGETGFLVPLRDPAALAAAIGRLLADKELAGRMGRAARALALAEFDENVVFERTIAAYRDLIADRRL